MSNTQRACAVAFVVVTVVVGATATRPAAQGTGRDLAQAIQRIRDEATSRSEVMRTLHVLTDVYGPRVTGSPSLKAAGQWAVDTMLSWGLTRGQLEPWEFGHPGWVNERFSAHLVSPVKDALVGEVQAWTPSTTGPVTGRVVQLSLPVRPTVDELTTYLDSMKGEVRGRLVLADKHVPAPVTLSPNAARRPDDRVREQFDPDRPQTPPGGRGGGPSQPPPLSAGEISRRVDEFLVANGALARLNDGRRELGVVAAFHNRTFDLSKAVPTVILRNDDYGRMARLVADDRVVEIELSINNVTYPEGRTAYNAVAEWAGTDKPDEVVMLGAHLDSWHAATGATDNAVGCATMMEAVRILKVLNLRPRRTVRVALWSGEEQGILGSQAYVDQHFGTAEAPKPEFAKLSAYLNLDTGTGRIRGATVFGPPDAASVIRRILAPFADLGVAGAIATDRRAIGGTDHTAFNRAGLPGIGLSQDPIQYEPFTHHTNLDTYERVLEEDVKSAAAVVAATVYELAMRDDLLPRFAADAMPKTAN
jgi:carboxypeptidase Q